MTPSRALLLMTAFSALVVAIGFEVLKPRAPDPIPDLTLVSETPASEAGPRTPRRPEPSVPPSVVPPATETAAVMSNETEPGTGAAPGEVGNEYDSLDEITEGNYDQRPLPRVHRPRRPRPEALKHILEED